MPQVINCALVINMVNSFQYKVNGGSFKSEVGRYVVRILKGVNGNYADQNALLEYPGILNHHQLFVGGYDKPFDQGIGAANFCLALCGR